MVGPGEVGGSTRADRRRMSDQATGEAAVGRRRGREGEGGRRRARRDAGFQQPPWRKLVNRYRPVEVLRPGQLEGIHDASMTILDTSRLEILSTPALDL